MKRTITQTERLRVAEWLTDGRQLLDGVEDIERQIAFTLGFDPIEATSDTIMDAIGVALPVDTLLERLHIGVDDQA